MRESRLKGLLLHDFCLLLVFATHLDRRYIESEVGKDIIRLGATPKIKQSGSKALVQKLLELVTTPSGPVSTLPFDTIEGLVHTADRSLCTARDSFVLNTWLAKRYINKYSMKVAELRDPFSGEAMEEEWFQHQELLEKALRCFNKEEDGDGQNALTNLEKLPKFIAFY